jgi:DNA-binding transcriptional LysR family regulator
MSTLDLKLLSIMDELFRTRSVSQTAENLGLNQPAVSMSLARLRKHFNDPLFVKTHQRMEPTAHAIEIMPSVRQAHELLRAALEHRDVFEPATSNRAFRIAATDIGQVVILPMLMKRLRQTAPQATVDFSNFSPSSAGQLESGDLDVAIGFITTLSAGFHRRKLFAERFVCVARAGHPSVSDVLTLAQFQRELHLVVTTSGTAHNVLEKTLEANGIRRQVGLRVPNYLGLATLISSTDLLVTVPERLASVVEGLTDVRVFPTPFEIPSYFVTQYWHARSARDPGIRWLRALITELFEDRTGN